MTVYAVTGALIGTAAERPPADAATNNRVVGGPLYIASDTGEIFESTGAEWVSIDQLPAGTSLPGATSNPIIPQDIIFGGNVTVDADLTSGSPNFQTVGQWTISQDGSFYQYIYDNNNYPIQTTIADSGDPIPGRTPYTGDVYRILGTVRGRIWGIDATNGDMTSVGGLGLHGHAAQSTPRTLAQSVITAITDANAKTAVQAVANALADIGALSLT